MEIIISNNANKPIYEQITSCQRYYRSKGL